MASWNDILEGINLEQSRLATSLTSVHDATRRKYLRAYSELTKRNLIVYYSGWLQKTELSGQQGVRFDINDSDKDGFMATVHKMDRSLGLDLFLHTPGGEIAATESIVDYLRAMFPGDLRVFVPQLALSAGTMIACAANQIWMGKHSSIGPIDPQINGIPAHGIIEEFEKALSDIQKTPASFNLWQLIISKYHPTLIGECEKGIKWADEMVAEWLVTGMFKGDPSGATKASKIVEELDNHSLTKSHSRHISSAKARSIGLAIHELEEAGNEDLQDAVLSIHHACVHTLTQTNAFKLIENHMGGAFIQMRQPK